MGEDIKMEKSVEDMVPNRFHKYLLVFKKKELECLPLWKPCDHAIKTKPGFQPKKSKVHALSPKEQEEVDDFINEQLRKGYVYLTIQVTSNITIPKKDHKKKVYRLSLSK